MLIINECVSSALLKVSRHIVCVRVCVCVSSALSEINLLLLDWRVERKTLLNAYPGAGTLAHALAICEAQLAT